MNFKLALLFSILLHGVIAGVGIVYFTLPQSQSDLYINSYLASKITLTEYNLGRDLVNSHAQQALPLKQAANTNLTAYNISSSQKQALSYARGTVSAIKKIIHNAAQNALVYPMAARMAELKGTVRLQFVLQKDGTINSIKVIKTSSSKVLDDAALATLQSISPVTAVIPLVKKSTILTMDIKYY